MTESLTTQQRNVLEYLPATVEEVATDFGVTTSTIRDHLSSIRSAGISVSNENGVYSYNGDHISTSMPQANHASKAAQSKAANNHLAELNDRLAKLLNNSAPAVADGGLQCKESNEDVVIHRSDDHIGNIVYDEFGNLCFDNEIAAERIRSVTDSVMNLIDREGGAEREYDTAHLLLGGDTVTGEQIYNHQTPDEQIDLAADLYFEQIERLAARFPDFQVLSTKYPNQGSSKAKNRNS